MAGKDFHLTMVVKAPAGEGAAPLVSWKAQWHSFHSALSSEVNICKDCGGYFMTKTVRFLRLAVVSELLGSLGVKAAGILLFSFFA